MIRTIEAVIDEQGNVRLLENVHLPAVRRALVTILEEKPSIKADDTQLTLDQLLAGVSEQNLHHEINTGNAMGNEVW